MIAKFISETINGIIGFRRGPWENLASLVIGLGVSGVAASELCLSLGAHVFAVDGADGPALREQANKLRERGTRCDEVVPRLV